MWQKEEVDSTIRLEKSLQGHPQTAKPMVEHLLGRRAKQISDTGSRHTKSWTNSTTPQPLESIRSSSENKSELRTITTRLYVSQNEDKLFSDQGDVSRQTSPRPRHRLGLSLKGTLGRICQVLGDTRENSTLFGKAGTSTVS